MSDICLNEFDESLRIRGKKKTMSAGDLGISHLEWIKIVNAANRGDVVAYALLYQIPQAIRTADPAYAM